MTLEVEMKFRVSDLAAAEARARSLGAEFGEAEPHVDRYFNHPAKDYAQTDEAFRIRAIGERAFVTYKGPKLDQATKTRREIELPIVGFANDDAPATVERWSELIEALGFRRVTEVRKSRREATLTRAGRTLHVTLDDVAGVGTYAEVETIAEAHDRAEAIAAVQSLAAELGLHEPERRSYLEMLLIATVQR